MVFTITNLQVAGGTVSQVNVVIKNNVVGYSSTPLWS